MSVMKCWEFALKGEYDSNNTASISHIGAQQCSGRSSILRSIAHASLEVRGLRINHFGQRFNRSFVTTTATTKFGFQFQPTIVINSQTRINPCSYLFFSQDRVHSIFLVCGSASLLPKQKNGPGNFPQFQRNNYNFRCIKKKKNDARDSLIQRGSIFRSPQANQIQQLREKKRGPSILNVSTLIKKVCNRHEAKIFLFTLINSRKYTVGKKNVEKNA